MELTDARISLLIGSESTTIEFIDNASNTTFAKATLTPEQLSQALSRVSYTPCEIEVRGLERVGKKCEVSQLEFEVPEGFTHNSKSYAVLNQRALRVAPPGWTPDNYYGSQNSFFQKDGKKYARCTIRRWVEINPETTPAP